MPLWFSKVFDAKSNAADLSVENANYGGFGQALNI